MAQSKNFDFTEIKKKEFSVGLEGKIATQIMSLYRACLSFDKPVALECGTYVGYSTTVLAEACELKQGHLVSTDIEDCSDVVSSPQWTFIQSDDSKINYILDKAPILKQGIDLLYIDSAHNRDHVEKLLMGWYPYLNQGAYIFFDDIDANPYRRNNRKDNYFFEVAWDEIGELTKEFFYANEEQLFLEHHFGSTGIAKMYKLSPKGTLPLPPVPIIRRKRTLYNQLFYKIKQKLSQ